MKSLKMFGLIALAALMAMAFVGGSSAMAGTHLCTADEANCAKGNIITHVHETSVGKAILLTNTITVSCNVLFLGEVVEEGEAGQAVVEGNFTFSNCGSSCTVTEESASSRVEVEKSGHETGSVAGEGEVLVNCLGIKCFYNGKGLIGTAKGLLLSTAANGEISLQEKTVNLTKGTFCPSVRKLDITTTPLIGTHITE
ncbi:MAG TPA: hypothetical protein VFJ64_09740 [Solirubrobacterales bacterium]|nr:hypothetical protein [Solirubrobacterales bacterium]